MTKTCTKCGISKDARSFYGRSGKPIAACKECTKAYMRKHREENYERVKEYTDRSCKKYMLNHRDRAREATKRWDARNRDKCREYLKQWRKRNPEKDREYIHRRRARKLVGGGSVGSSEWVDLCASYGNVCLNCGSSSITIDHVVPLSKGGQHHISNVQPLCQSCNSQKGTKSIDYRQSKKDRIGYNYDS